MDPEAMCLKERTQNLMRRQSNAFTELLPCLRSEAASRALVQTEQGWEAHHDGRLLEGAKPLNIGGELQQAGIIAMFGVGSGGLFLQLAGLVMRTGASLFVFEPDKHLAAAFLVHRHELGGIDGSRIGLFTSLDAMTLHLSTPENASGALKTAILPTYSRCYPGLVTEFQHKITHGRMVALSMAKDQTERVPTLLYQFLVNFEKRTRFPTALSLENAFRDKPALILAAGPGLDKNLHLLTPEIRERCLLIAMNSSLSAMKRLGVLPHLVVSMETGDTTSDLVDMPDEVFGVYSQHSHPNAFGETGARLFIYPTLETYSMSFLKKTLQKDQDCWESGPCVANTAFLLARKMGCEPIALIGQDLAFEGERAYASVTRYGEVSFRDDGQTGAIIYPDQFGKNESEGNRARYQSQDGVAKQMTEVPAWSGHGMVRTTLDMAMFRMWLGEQAAKMGEQGLRPPINATESGARFDHFEHIPLQQFLAECLGDSFRPNVMLTRIWEETERIDPKHMDDMLVELRQQATSFRAYSRLVLERLEPLCRGEGGEAELKQYEEAAAVAGPYSNHVPLVLGLCAHRIDTINKQPPSNKPGEAFIRARTMFQVLVEGCREVLGWVRAVRYKT